MTRSLQIHQLVVCLLLVGFACVKHGWAQTSPGATQVQALGQSLHEAQQVHLWRVAAWGGVNVPISQEHFDSIELCLYLGLIFFIIIAHILTRIAQAFQVLLPELHIISIQQHHLTKPDHIGPDQSVAFIAAWDSLAFMEIDV